VPKKEIEADNVNG